MSLFGLVLSCFPPPFTTTIKALSSKQRPCIFCRSCSHPSDCPNDIYRRAPFGGVLTLDGQRNHRKQLLSHSGSERLTCNCLCGGTLDTLIIQPCQIHLPKHAKKCILTFLSLPFIQVFFHCADLGLQ